MSKSSDKPKKQQKQKPQKTLKERRSEKRAAKKFGSSVALLPADTVEPPKLVCLDPRSCGARAVMRLGVRGDADGCRHASQAADARRSAS